jgi:hypothetical protein
MCDYKNNEEIKKEIEANWIKAIRKHDYGISYVGDFIPNITSLQPRTPAIGYDNNEKKSNVRYGDDSIKIRDAYGYYAYLMPNIEDVRVVNKPNTDEPKVVMVDFADGTTEKAILSDEDTYSLETGISICITKKLMSVSDSVSGTKVYNSVIRHAMKVMKENREWEDEARRADEAEKQRAKKLAEKRARRQARREAAETEKLIDVLAEAIKRATDKK